MHFNHPTVASTDLPIIRKHYLRVAQKYPQNSIRLNYILSACELFNEQEKFDHDIALKFRPYGDLIGIDNSSLDHQLKSFKVLRLHAVLHDAGGFIWETYNQGPGYSHMLPWESSTCFSGDFSGILFCLYIKTFHPSNFHFLECSAAKQLCQTLKDFVTEKKNLLLKNLVCVPKTILIACPFYLQQVIVS